MGRPIESRPPASDEIVIRPTRYRPRWTVAYIAAALILWSAVVELAMRVMYWLAQV